MSDKQSSSSASRLSNAEWSVLFICCLTAAGLVLAIKADLVPIWLMVPLLIVFAATLYNAVQVLRRR